MIVINTEHMLYLLYGTVFWDSNSSPQLRGLRRGTRVGRLRLTENTLCKTESMYREEIHSCAGVQTYSLLSAPSSASCSTESEEETLDKEKVTLLFGGLPFTAWARRGLEKVCSFHLIAQRLTTLWTWDHICRTQTWRDKYPGHTCACTHPLTCSRLCCVRLTVRSFMWVAYVAPSRSSLSLESCAASSCFLHCSVTHSLHA